MCSVGGRASTDILPTPLSSRFFRAKSTSRRCGNSISASSQSSFWPRSPCLFSSNLPATGNGCLRKPTKFFRSISTSSIVTIELVDIERKNFVGFLRQPFPVAGRFEENKQGDRGQNED